MSEPSSLTSTSGAGAAAGPFTARLREWGSRASIRYVIRRAGFRLWRVLQELDYISDLHWRSDYLVRHGAQFEGPVMAPEGTRVVGPAHLLRVGKFTGLAWRSTYFTSDGQLLPYYGKWRRAPISLGKDVHMGNCVVVLPGVSIGPRAAVAASSVVSRDVVEHAVATGRPARVIGNFERFFEQTLADAKNRPHLYRESFPYARMGGAHDGPAGGNEGWVLPPGADLVTNIRRFLRNVFVGIWDQLQERDEFVASQQRIFLLRKRGCQIGKHCYIDPTAILDRRTDKIVIGNHCSIGPQVAIHVHEGFLASHIGKVRVEPVHIKDGSSIGAATVIMPGVTIGPGSVVEPGSTVLTNVPPYTVVAGSPARKVGSLWDWLAARRQDMEAHPERYVSEPRLALYPVPPKEAASLADATPRPEPSVRGSTST